MRIMRMKNEAMECVTIAKDNDSKIIINTELTGLPLLNGYIEIPFEEYAAAVRPIIDEINV